MQCWNPKFEKIKVWQRWSDSRLKWMKCVLNLILSIGMPYYQEGCNIDYLTRSKVLIDDPCENTERKPLRTNFVLLGWSSVNLVDQVEHLNLGLGFSGPDRSDRSRGPVWPVQGVTASFWTDRSDRSVGPVWPVCTDRATASFWKWGIYTPQLSPLRAAGSLAFLSFPKPYSWPASSPQHSLWVEPTRFHIL